MGGIVERGRGVGGSSGVCWTWQVLPRAASPGVASPALLSLIGMCLYPGPPWRNVSVPYTLGFAFGHVYVSFKCQTSCLVYIRLRNAVRYTVSVYTLGSSLYPPVYCSISTPSALLSTSFSLTLLRPSVCSGLASLPL